MKREEDQAQEQAAQRLRTRKAELEDIERWMEEEWISYAHNGYVMFESKLIQLNRTKMLPPTLSAQQGGRERGTSLRGGL